MIITSEDIITQKSINGCVGPLALSTDINLQNISSGSAITIKTTPMHSIATAEISADGILGTNLKDEIYNMILSRLAVKPIIQHKCHNCGGTVELNENKHIFICPYCDAHYAVGIYCGINDRGD